jgi:hypothetical protein
MAEPIVEPNVTPVPVNESQPAPTPTHKPVTWDDLTDEQKRYVDQERTKASQTARENAKKDPKFIEEVKKSLEPVIQQTAEQKLQARLDELAVRANKMEAMEVLRKSGLGDEAIQSIVEDAELDIVSPDRDKTLARVSKLGELFKSSLEKSIAEQTKKAAAGIQTPKTAVPVNKAFKDMTFEERAELKKKDPARFEIEQKALSSKI